MALRVHRLVPRADHVLVGARLVGNVVQVLGDGLAGDGHAVAVQQAVRRAASSSPAARRRPGAGRPRRTGPRASGRTAPAPCWRMRSKSSIVHSTLGRVRDRQVVQHGVGRAAGRHDHRDRVLDRLARDDVARLQVLLDRLDQHAAPTPRRCRLSPSSGDGHRASEPSRLMPSASNDDDIVLAVYMPPHEPTPGRRSSRCRRSPPSLILPAVNAPTASNDADDGEVLALPVARLDGAAVDVDRRHVDARHGHHPARHVLVAAADARARRPSTGPPTAGLDRSRRSPRATPASTSCLRCPCRCRR